MNNRRPPELIPAHYTNWMPFVVVRSSTGFSITSRPTPVGAIATTTAAIGIFFIWMSVLVYSSKVAFEGAFGVVLGLGILTTVGTPLGIVLKFRHQQRLGPVLVFDAREGVFDMPRHPKHLMIEEVDCLCLVTACEGGDWCSQLQLHTRQGGRFLLVPAWTRRELERMLNEIIPEIPVRVCCYTEDRKAPEKWREKSLHEV
jgi:hypothetical protein